METNSTLSKIRDFARREDMTFLSGELLSCKESVDLLPLRKGISVRARVQPASVVHKINTHPSSGAVAGQHHTRSPEKSTATPVSTPK
jgi:hypothetical protein